MQKASVEAIVRAFQEHDVRYIIVGGLAVVAHGYLRFTADVDVVVDFEPANLERVEAALSLLEYQPRAPVPFAAFKDAATRHQWLHEKNMLVFSLYSSQHARTELDIFIEQPFDFEVAFARSEFKEIVPGIQARIVAFDDLMTLKTQAGRAQDLADIEQLNLLRGDA